MRSSLYKVLQLRTAAWAIKNSSASIVKTLKYEISDEAIQKKEFNKWLSLQDIEVEKIVALV